MVNEIITIYLNGLNKVYGSKFYIGSQIQYETPEESQKRHQPKCCEYNNEDNSLNKLNDKK